MIYVSFIVNKSNYIIYLTKNMAINAACIDTKDKNVSNNVDITFGIKLMQQFYLSHYYTSKEYIKKHSKLTR